MLRLIVLPLLVGSLALGFAQPTAAQNPETTPSARELWDTYPLQATPEPGADRVQASPTAAATRRPAQPAQSSQSSQSGPSMVVAAMLLIVAFAVGFALAVHPPARLTRRRPQSSPEPAPTSPPMLEPPASGRPWSAEIEWHTAGGEGRFRAVARAADGREEAILVESPSVEWPPSSDTSLPTLTTAAEELEHRLIGAGWRPLPPGDTWYAKRFTWDPALWTSRRRFDHRGAKEKVT
jgi:hypothetical protein